MQPQKREHASHGPGVCKILQCIDWACAAVIIIFGIAIAGLDSKLQPVNRPIFSNDATISYKYRGNDAMPFWVALVVPAVVLVATILCIEYWAVQQHWQRAAANTANVLLSCFATLAMVAFMTELFKIICGRLRPDFLDRCQPLVTENGPIPYGTFPDVVCQNEKASTIKDGHLSFPSGHSSCSMSLGLFSALYLIWCLHWRDKGTLHAAWLSPAKNAAARVAKDLLGLGVLFVVLFDIAWPWGVAVSRFRDNRHNISDVIGGLFLAACFVPVFFVRFASCYVYNWGDSSWALQQPGEQQQVEMSLIEQGLGTGEHSV